MGTTKGAFNNSSSLSISYSSYSNSGSSSLNFCEYYYDELESYAQSLTTFTIFLGIIALLSNTLFLFTVAMQPHLRQTPVRAFLAALSFIDACLSICFTVIAFRFLLDVANDIYSFNVNLILFIRFPFQMMSSILIVMVTVERYKAICRPMVNFTSTPKQHDKFFFGIATLKCLIAGSVTTLVFVLSVILYEIWGTQKPECPESSELVLLRKLPDQLNNALKDSLKVINYIMVALDVATIFISVSLSLLIYRELGKVPSLRRVNGNGKRYAREQRNMTKMVVANTLVFCLFVLLQDIFSCIVISLDITLSSTGIKAYIYLVLTLSLLNSGINPIIYNTFGSVYRSAFLKTFKCARCAQSWIGISITERSSTSFETQVSALQKFNIEEKPRNDNHTGHLA